MDSLNLCSLRNFEDCFLGEVTTTAKRWLLQSPKRGSLLKLVYTSIVVTFHGLPLHLRGETEGSGEDAEMEACSVHCTDQTGH